MIFVAKFLLKKLPLKSINQRPFSIESWDLMKLSGHWFYPKKCKSTQTNKQNKTKIIIKFKKSTSL